MNAAAEAENSPAGRFARSAAIHAAWPALLVLGVLVAMAAAPPSRSAASTGFVLGAAPAALAVLTLSLVVGFDALLFRLIASHRAEEAGCAAVDELLARMRLKPRPPATRPLAARIAGTRRLLLGQRLALGLFLACAALSR